MSRRPALPDTLSFADWCLSVLEEYDPDTMEDENLVPLVDVPLPVPVATPGTAATPLLPTLEAAGPAAPVAEQLPALSHAQHKAMSYMAARMGNNFFEDEHDVVFMMDTWTACMTQMVKYRGDPTWPIPEIFAKFTLLRKAGVLDPLLASLVEGANRTDQPPQAPFSVSADALPHQGNSTQPTQPAQGAFRARAPELAIFSGPKAANSAAGVRQIALWVESASTTASLSGLVGLQAIAWATQHFTHDAAVWFNSWHLARSCDSFEQLRDGLTQRFIGANAFILLTEDLRSKSLRSFPTFEKFFGWFNATITSMRAVATPDRMWPDTVLVDQLLMAVTGTLYVDDVHVNPVTRTRPASLDEVTHLLCQRHEVLLARLQAHGQHAAVSPTQHTPVPAAGPVRTHGQQRPHKRARADTAPADPRLAAVPAPSPAVQRGGHPRRAEARPHGAPRDRTGPRILTPEESRVVLEKHKSKINRERHMYKLSREEAEDRFVEGRCFRCNRFHFTPSPNTPCPPSAMRPVN